MKALKIVIGVFLILALILGAGAFYLYKNIEGIAKRAIETEGSRISGTEVRVDGVTLALRQGRGEISGLSIANPTGFSDNLLFDLDTVALEIMPTSVRDEVIVLREVLIDGARLRVEHQGVADTNIKKLLDNIRASVGSDDAAPEDKAGDEPLFMVEKLRFANISMDVVSPQLEDRTLTLKDIERTNLGSRQQGLTGKGLALAITRPLLDEAKDRFEDELKGRAGDKLKDVLDEKLSDENKQKVDQLRSLLR